MTEKKFKMKVFIATKNKDKWDIFQKLFWEISPTYQLDYYDKAHSAKTDRESGGLKNRARKKAVQFIEDYEEKFGQKYDIVIGVDDAISVRQDPPSLNTHGETTKLLNGYYALGTPVKIVRGIYIDNRVSSNQNYFEIVSPFYLKESGDTVSNKSYEYPLSEVLAPKEYNKVASQISQSEMDEFNSKYMLPKLRAYLQE